MATTQEDRTIRIETPAAENTLLVHRVEGAERVSGLFEFRLALLSETHDLKPDQFIAKPMTLHVELDDKKLRHFHGIVKRFTYGGKAGDFSNYSAEIVPWLWLLTRTHNCRIFQQKTIPQVLDQLFGEWQSKFPDFVKFTNRTQAGNYRVHDYCVQYRESDFDFVSRLMEEEGIFYYFQHTDKSHVMVFGDSPQHHDACPVREKADFIGDEDFEEDIDESILRLVKRTASGLAKSAAETAASGILGLAFPLLGPLALIPGLASLIPGVKDALAGIVQSILEDVLNFLGLNDNVVQNGVKAWRDSKEMRAGKCLLRDYHFELPDKTLENQRSTLFPLNGNQNLSLYDYPGGFAHRFNKTGERLGDVDNEGQRLVARRMEEEEVEHHTIEGIARQAVFTAGHRFELTFDKLKEHPRKDELKGKYLLTEVKHTILQSPPFESVDEDQDKEELKVMKGPYRNRFFCIPLAVQYRPARTTERPVIAGLQTAKVVGPEDKEIHVDKFGRVLVAFPWDREDEKKKHGDNSCLLRVAQFWAGKRWGASFWPRIGQEVVVAFLEGDPDQPLIVGSVNNFDQMPDYLGDGPDKEHPHNPNLSGIKTCTTPDGQGFNELRFDDTRDKEQVFVHAERDMDTVVWQDRKDVVARNRHLEVGGVDIQSKKLVGDAFEAVANNKHVIVLHNHEEHVAGSMKLKIGGERKQYALPEHSGAFSKVPDGGNLSLVVTGGSMESVGGDKHLVVYGDRLTKVKGCQHLCVEGDQQESITGNHAMEACEIHVKAGMTLVLEADIQLSLKVGGNFIDIGPAGISIQGTTVLINSGGAPAVGAGCNVLEAKGAAEAKPTTPLIPDETKTAASGFPSEKRKGFTQRPDRPVALAIKQK